jgi:hypothetical protein
MAKLKAPDNCTSCSFNEEVFEVDDKGTVTVPEEAVADLLDHGFTIASAEPPKKAK